MAKLNEITDAIKTEWATALPTIELYESEVPADVLQRVSQGRFQPYGVLHIDVPIRAARDKGIVTSRRDLLVSTVMLAVYAPTVDAANDLRDDIMDVFVDFRPGDAQGRMVLDGGMSWTEKNSSAVPMQYVRSVVFQLRWGMV